MATAIDTVGAPGRTPRQPIVIRNDRRTVDKVFRGVARATGYGTLILLFLIGLFLLIEGFPAFHVAGWKFFTTSGFQTIGKTLHFGVEASLYGTVVVALVALVVGAPVAIADVAVPHRIRTAQPASFLDCRGRPGRRHSQCHLRPVGGLRTPAERGGDQFLDVAPSGLDTDLQSGDARR